MPDTVELNRQLKIIEVHSFGTVSDRDLESSIAAVNKIKDETGINAILVDTTEQESLPDTAEDIRFIETVAHNRGIQIRIFSARKEALDWLTRLSHQDGEKIALRASTRTVSTDLAQGKS